MCDTQTCIPTVATCTANNRPYKSSREITRMGPYLPLQQRVWLFIKCRLQSYQQKPLSHKYNDKNMILNYKRFGNNSDDYPS